MDANRANMMMVGNAISGTQLPNADPAGGNGPLSVLIPPIAAQAPSQSIEIPVPNGVRPFYIGPPVFPQLTQSLQTQIPAPGFGQLGSAFYFGRQWQAPYFGQQWLEPYFGQQGQANYFGQQGQAPSFVQQWAAPNFGQQLAAPNFGRQQWAAPNFGRPWRPHVFNPPPPVIPGQPYQIPATHPRYQFINQIPIYPFGPTSPPRNTGQFQNPYYGQQSPSPRPRPQQVAPSFTPTGTYSPGGGIFGPPSTESTGSSRAGSALQSPMHPPPRLLQNAPMMSPLANPPPFHRQVLPRIPARSGPTGPSTTGATAGGFAIPHNPAPRATRPPWSPRRTNPPAGGKFANKKPRFTSE